ncbi:MAG TPA: hypothetical protein ENH06_02030 [bacterium]|nr:hypothetical protein [bacterium]
MRKTDKVLKLLKNSSKLADIHNLAYKYKQDANVPSKDIIKLISVFSRVKEKMMYDMSDIFDVHNTIIMIYHAIKNLKKQLKELGYTEEIRKYKEEIL